MPSKPTHGVTVHQDVMVELRDGISLATDIYRPADPDTGEPIDDPRPALLARTPYDKRERHRIEDQGNWYAKRGYVVAIQDVRGRYGSDGEFYLLINEAKDGADTVEWLGSRPYCDGQVGTMGTSYMAWAQNALATQDPEHLAAMFVNQGAANAWKATLRHHGAFELRWLTWSLTIGGGFAKRALEDLDLERFLASVDTRYLLDNEPVIPGQSPLRRLPNYEEYVFDYMDTPGDDEFWDDPSINFEAHYSESADVPTVYAGSWYDSYTKATCDNFEALAERKDSDHFLLMGAWTHGGQSTWTRPYSGETSFGEAATRDYLETKLRFFDQYLKGDETWDDPPVQYVLMGTGDGTSTTEGRLNHGGRWNEASEWPLPDVEFQRYYAHGDGTLDAERPTESESTTTYAFDPRDPVPTIGGNCSSYYTFEQRTEPIEEFPLADRPTVSITGRGGYDQRTRSDTFGADPPYGPLEERNDVVVFRTPSLTDSVEIVGPVRVTIYASTDAKDTDFTAKLIDEHPPSDDFPSGFALNLTDSICRARYRDYRREPDPVIPGDVYAFELELYPTANVFKSGHRIRLDISSSNYPRYDVNHNTGKKHSDGRKYEIATNTIYHDADHSTHVELPIRSR